jgi:hypothetical protein
MFPTAIEKTSAATRGLYKASLPLAVALWLLPLFAVALTSLRSIEDRPRSASSRTTRRCSRPRRWAGSSSTRS